MNSPSSYAQLRLLKAIAAPLATLYGTVMRTREAAYRNGFFKVKEVEGAAVISVGNLTTGGTGKTPLVKLIARLAAEEMKAIAPASEERASICILSRGYGRRNPRRRVVVSNGHKLLADALDGGDEPRELAEGLLGIAAVISDADRVASGRWAQQHLGSRVLLLDDGFQHMRLKRDLNIVTLDATDPWGGEHLLPHGRLREHPTALRRADLMVLTRVDQVKETRELEQAARALSGDAPILRGSSRIRNLHLLTSYKEEDMAMPSTGRRALAFCALGNPDSFFNLLRREEWTLAHTMRFDDHHLYTQTDADHINVAARESGAELLLTTAKDAVKLHDLTWSLPCYVVEIDLVIDNEMLLRRLIRFVIGRLAR